MLGEVLARGDAQFGREALEQHGHQVAGDYDPEQQVAVLRAGLDVGGVVARVHVGDAGDEQDRNRTRLQKYQILFHGGGEDERGWATQGKTDLILDNLIAEKKAKPMLIVMADGNFSTGGFGENNLKAFETELKQCLIPFVEKNFRVETDAKNRALAGLSMGGIQTLYAGVNNTQLFSYLGVFSSGWIQPMQADIANKQYKFMKNKADTINSNLKLLWITMGGKEDIAYKNCQLMLEKFDEMKIKYTYSEYPGGHTWPVWRNNLYNFAQMLFK